MMMGELSRETKEQLKAYFEEMFDHNGEKVTIDTPIMGLSPGIEVYVRIEHDSYLSFGSQYIDQVKKHLSPDRIGIISNGNTFTITLTNPDVSDLRTETQRRNDEKKAFEKKRSELMNKAATTEDTSTLIRVKDLEAKHLGVTDDIKWLQSRGNEVLKRVDSLEDKVREIERNHE